MHHTTANLLAQLAIERAKDSAKRNAPPAPVNKAPIKAALDRVSQTAVMAGLIICIIGMLRAQGVNCKTDLRCYIPGISEPKDSYLSTLWYTLQSISTDVEDVFWYVCMVNELDFDVVERFERIDKAAFEAFLRQPLDAPKLFNSLLKQQQR